MDYMELIRRGTPPPKKERQMILKCLGCNSVMNVKESDINIDWSVSYYSDDYTSKNPKRKKRMEIRT